MCFINYFNKKIIVLIIRASYVAGTVLGSGGMTEWNRRFPVIMQHAAFVQCWDALQNMKREK